MSPVALITALPTFISPAEHHDLQSTTPASFAGIPPILRQKQDSVVVTFDPPLAGLEDEQLRKGTLYIAENALFFFADSSSHGFKIEYPTITLHAVSRAESGPSMYCQLDESVGPGPQAATEDEDAEMRELIIVPQSAEALETMFEALSLCASLHPDPMDRDEGDETFMNGDSAGGFETFDGDEQEELSAVGRAALEHLESIIDRGVGIKEDKAGSD